MFHDNVFFLIFVFLSFLFYFAPKSFFFHGGTIKKGISDAGTPQPDRDLNVETLLVKL